MLYGRGDLVALHALRNPAPLRITTVMLKLARSRLLLLLRERMMLMMVVMGGGHPR